MALFLCITNEMFIEVPLLQEASHAMKLSLFRAKCYFYI